MFVVFEGIDGSGKTTLSNRVATELRQQGLRVAHVREGGRFASRVTQAIRELGRDSRNLDMVPRTELLLFLARDVQLLEESTIPALADHDVVLADRFFYTAEVLARAGRGLDADEVLPLIRSVSRGVTPDLVILVDVDPHVARARRRVAKILVPDPRPSSRKGLAGVGLQHRLRQGYLDLASRDPSRWFVLDNTDASLDESVTLLVSLIRGHSSTSRDQESSRLATASVQTPIVGPGEPRDASGHLLQRSAESQGGSGRRVSLDRFLDWIDRRAEREPATAAYFLAGLAGVGVDERRLALVERAPELIAHGLRGLTDEVSAHLRRVLAPRTPGLVARSLAATAGDGDAAWLLREALVEQVPEDVVSSLDGRDDPQSWAMRDRLYPRVPDAVVATLKRLATPRAWELRERWIASKGGEAAMGQDENARTLCESLNGVDDERAWELRKLVRDEVPVATLGSLGGLVSETAWKWRRRALERAPKVVLRTVAGIDDPRAWDLREAVATRVKESIDSMLCLDGDRAWSLREACVDIWPSTVVKSLGPLASSPRGEALVARQLARYPENISLLKHAAALELGADVMLTAETE